MNQKLKMHLQACPPIKEGFSFDELVFETKRMFEQEGMPGFLRIVTALLDLIVCLPLLGKWERSDTNCLTVRNLEI